jgi:ABC-type uncharacterized transport system YnjBCD ATPase subunit
MGNLGGSSRAICRATSIEHHKLTDHAWISLQLASSVELKTLRRSDPATTPTGARARPRFSISLLSSSPFNLVVCHKFYVKARLDRRDQTHVWVYPKCSNRGLPQLKGSQYGAMYGTATADTSNGSHSVSWMAEEAERK